MGTGFDMTILPEELGVIPRAVQEIFTGIEERRSSASEKNEPLPQFEVKAQFLEVRASYILFLTFNYYLQLYNEEIIDLFEEQVIKIIFLSQLKKLICNLNKLLTFISELRSIDAMV